MSTITDCTVTAPTTSVGPDESFEVRVEVTVVNNALVCHCVDLAVVLTGTRRVTVETATVEVPIGGGDNPTEVRIATPVSADNPALPDDGGDVAVSVEKVRDESGCGLWTCDEGTAAGGTMTRLDG